MYNKEQKEQFIKAYTNAQTTERTCSNVFDIIESYETKWGADLCTRTKEELELMLKNIVGLRSRSALPVISIVKEYCAWCVANNIPGAKDEAAYIKVEGSNKMKTQTVSSPVELQVYLDTLFTPEDDNTIDNTFRAYCWLSYAGLDETAVLETRCKDVDFQNMKIRSRNKEYPIYTEGLKAFKYCVESDAFEYSHPLYSNVISRPRVEGDLLLRGIKSQPKRQAFRIQLSKKSREALDKGDTDLKLSISRIYLSGIFYRMYQRELAGFEVDFLPDAEAFMEGREYHFEDTHNTEKEKKKQIAKDYKRDYARWKKSLV